jgi:hypothetical protein
MLVCFVGMVFAAAVVLFALALLTASKRADEQWERIARQLERRMRNSDADH